VDDVQQPRHVSERRVLRLRQLLRSGVVGLLALPSVLGVTSLLGVPLTALVPHHRAPGAGTTTAMASPILDTATADPPAADDKGSGESAGSQFGAPPLHTVVGLGDSVPAGSACECSDYVSLLAQSLGRAHGSTVQSTNLASPGQTSSGLLDQLGDAGVRSAVAGADVVVLTIGANDVEGTNPTSCPSGNAADGDAVVATCFAPRLDALAGNLDRALGQLTSLPTTPGARVLVTGYWNVYLDGAVAKARGETYVQLADAATRAVNARIASAARAHGATFVDLFPAFRGDDGSQDCTDLLAPDGDHPDADGHALIARVLAAAL
jgi:lysophospholipase L1-like esterase